VAVRNHAARLLAALLACLRDACGPGGAAPAPAPAASAEGDAAEALNPAATARGRSRARGEELAAGGDRFGAPQRWSVYTGVVFPQLKRMLSDARRELRTEGLRLIMAAAAAFSGFHADLATLAHEDPEQDVAQNLTHIQLHRRIKALRRLAELAAGLAPSTLRHILFPVVWFSAIEPAEQDRMKKTEGAYNLSDEVGSPSPNLSLSRSLSLSLALSRSLSLSRSRFLSSSSRA